MLLRSTITQRRLNHAMTLYLHKEKTDEIDLDEAVNFFIFVNDRRSNYFGHN